MYFLNVPRDLILKRAFWYTCQGYLGTKTVVARKSCVTVERYIFIGKASQQWVNNRRSNNVIYWNWLSSVGNSTAVEGMKEMTVTVLDSRSLCST